MEKKLDKGKVVWSSCCEVSYGKRTRKFMINKGCYADETCLPSSSLPDMGGKHFTKGNECPASGQAGQS